MPSAPLRSAGPPVPSQPTRVLALGHPDRGDDGAGPAVAKRLLELLGERVGERVGADPPGEIDLRQVPGEATEILAAWEGAESVVVIDAVRTRCRPRAEPGTVHRFGAEGLPPDLPQDLHSSSSHGLGLAHAVALGRTLGRLPARLVIYGIEAHSFAPGAPLHPAVDRAVGALARLLADELLRGHAPPARAV